MMADNNHILRQSMPNGVEFNVVRARDKGLLYDQNALSRLYELIESDAKAHGTSVSKDNLGRVMHSICAGKLQACFLFTRLQKGLPQYAGGAIELPSVFTRWNGNSFVHYPATYSEDTFVYPELSAKFRAETKTALNPKGIGLGTCFTHERIRLASAVSNSELSFGKISRARISENAQDNHAMLHILKKLGATVETKNGQILELAGDAPLPVKQKKIPTKIMCLTLCGNENGFSIQPNVFLVNWVGYNGEQKITATFTEAISTFSGETIIRVQLTSSSILPPKDKLNEVISAILTAGRTEVLERNWAGKDTPPTMRIHAINEPQIVASLIEIGAHNRLLGTRPMLPVVADFANIPPAALDFKPATTDPFISEEKLLEPYDETIQFQERYIARA